MYFGIAIDCFFFIAERIHHKLFIHSIIDGHLGGFQLLKFIFTYLLLTALGLHCCAWGFFSCEERELLSRSNMWASHCGGSSCCGAQALGTWAQ